MYEPARNESKTSVPTGSMKVRSSRAGSSLARVKYYGPSLPVETKQMNANKFFHVVTVNSVLSYSYYSCMKTTVTSFWMLNQINDFHFTIIVDLPSRATTNKHD